MRLRQQLTPDPVDLVPSRLLPVERRDDVWVLFFSNLGDVVGAGRNEFVRGLRFGKAIGRSADHALIAGAADLQIGARQIEGGN